MRPVGLSIHFGTISEPTSCTNMRQTFEIEEHNRVMTKGICLVCGSRTDVIKHHAKEMERRSDGSYESVALCGPCHVLHEKYVNALKTLGYEPDKLRVTRIQDVKKRSLADLGIDKKRV